MKLFNVFLFSWFVGIGFSQVVINEVSCSNRSHLDNYGDLEDWVELLNVGSTTIDLTGFYMTDNPNNWSKFQVGNIQIAPGQRIMVYCSTRNITLPNVIHTNFKLTQTRGEVFILSSPSLDLADSVHLRNKITQENHSFGRSTDGASDWKLFTTPTPNAPNTGATDFYMPRPTFSLTPGFYSAPQTVTITVPPGGTVRYTLDGTEPTAASTQYTGPITISTTSVLTAITFGPNLPSVRRVASYFINEQHNLPVVSVAGAGVATLFGGVGGTFEPTGHMELFEEDGTFIDAAVGAFNKHGNDSWAYAQRGVDYIVRDEFGDNDRIRHQIFPEKPRKQFKRLMFKAAANDNYPFSNGAHIRDAYVQTLSQKAGLLLDERTWRPCVLYLNGQYWGVYDIREKYDDHHFTEYYYNQSEFFGVNQQGLHFLKTWGATWEEYGIGEANAAWNDLRAFIMGNSMSDPDNFEYVDSAFNWRSLVDYFCINSWIVSQDWLNWNTAWWRGRNPDETKKKWRYTLWDMDAAFGHYINYTGVPQTGPDANPCNAENLPNPGGQGHTEILTKLLDEQPVVNQYYITRYIDLNNTYFHCDYAIALLDSMLNTFADEMPRQIATWGGTEAGYAAAVNSLRTFILNRCASINAGLVDCYDLVGPFEFIVDTEPFGGGEVKVNSIWAPTFPWNAEYFGNIETKLFARANPGFVFSHWEIETGPLLYPETLDSNGVDLQGPDRVVAVFIPTEIPFASTGVHVPNAFSPNGDGNNDLLLLFVGEDVLSFTFTVYDRWGNMVLRTSDPTFKWDGTFNNRALNTGVFAYELDIRYIGGLQEIKAGNITLIR
jgi:gliding motility-associated-like protein